MNTFFKCTDVLDSEGLTILNSNDNTVQHPLIKLKNDSSINIFKISKEFGANPLSRKKLMEEPVSLRKIKEEVQEELSDLEQYQRDEQLR